MAISITELHFQSVCNFIGKVVSPVENQLYLFRSLQFKSNYNCLLCITFEILPVIVAIGVKIQIFDLQFFVIQVLLPLFSAIGT